MQRQKPADEDWGGWQSTRNGNVVKSRCGGTGEGRGMRIYNNHSSLNNDRSFLSNDHSSLLCFHTRTLRERRKACIWCGPMVLQIPSNFIFFVSSALPLPSWTDCDCASAVQIK